MTRWSTAGMADQKSLTKPVGRSLSLQFGQFCWIHEGWWLRIRDACAGEGKVCLVYGENSQTRFARK